LAKFRRLDVGGWIFLNQAFRKTESKKMPDRYQMAGHRTAIQFFQVQRTQKIHDVRTLDLPSGYFLLSDKFRELQHVALVSVHGVIRQAFFDPQIIQERAYLRFQIQLPLKSR